MTQEEKAKAYDEAIERAMNIYGASESRDILTTLSTIFPELKESEDERIKALLIRLFSSNNAYEKFDDISTQDIIAWLEKQGEQKPTDKVEPKFKVGDVMRTLREVADNITSGLPVVVSIDEEYYHCTNELIAIKDQDAYEYPSMNRKVDKAIADAGYELDEENKMLKKIYNALEECEIENIEHGKYYYCIKDYYDGGNKRASKGDVVQALNGMSMMALGVKANEYFIPVKNFLCAIPTCWSEEDECYMTECINAIATKDGWSFEDKRKTKHWLKSLKDRL